jgi:hypothetical protein
MYTHRSAFFHPMYRQQQTENVASCLAKEEKRNFLSFCMIEFFISPSFQIQRGFHGNGFTVPQDTKLDFGTLGALPLEVTSTECASRSDFASNNQVSGHTSPISTSKKAGKRCNRAR